MKGISHRSEQNTDEENNVYGLRKYLYFGITLHKAQRKCLRTGYEALERFENVESWGKYNQELVIEERFSSEDVEVS